MPAPTAEAAPEPAPVAASPAAPAPHAPPPPKTYAPEEADLNALQRLPMPKLIKAADEMRVRSFPPRGRHALVADLVRAYLIAGTLVRAEGVLEQPPEMPHFPGTLRWPEFNFMPTPEDVTVPMPAIKALGLRPGLRLRCILRLGRGGGEKALAVDRVETVEGQRVDEWRPPVVFEQLTPLFPNKRIVLESAKYKPPTARVLDLLATLGRGQRGLILAPPRVGKTVLLRQIAHAIAAGSPDITLMLLLVDERPEEVTDFRRELGDSAEIYSSTFDEPPTRHVQIAEMVFERAKRLVELGKPVVVLLDSLTRLTRGFNNMQGAKGGLMSGGVVQKALIKPRKFFGAARNTEEGGSLTILASCLTDTGARMDEVIFEEFKGTGNLEIHLDRALSDKRIFPAIHVVKSGTRRDELLFHPKEFDLVSSLRRQLVQLPTIESMEVLLRNINATQNNAELLLKGLRQ